MKKIIGLLIFGILVFSGISNIVISKENQSNYRILDKILVSAPILNQEGEYISVSIDEADSLWLEPGKPQLPVVAKVYAFPLGTKIINVTIEKYSDEYELTKKVIPSPEPLQLSCLSSQCSNSNIINETVYGSSELYPSNSDHISKGAGLKDGEHVLFLNIKITPQYSPVNNLLLVPHEIKIIVEYIPPVEPLFNSDEYDMIIITNEDYISKFQRFIDHKNNLGIRTTIDSVENIYPNYDGRDEAEDIKLRIKDAVEKLGIEYVILAGGRKGQTLEWHIPDRKISNWESGRDCSSDHYFADIYKIVDDEVAFEDWDSNDNGLYAESSNEISINLWDEIDYYPDVVVGRLPFRYEHEIDPLIDKIIQYESSPDKQWFHNALVVSGDQYPPFMGGLHGIYEGEMETNVTANLLEDQGFAVVRLWQSTHSWNGRSDIIDKFSDGLGFVHFACHGNPISIGSYPADDEDGGLIEALRLKDIKRLDNGNSLPVVMIHGCHTAQFSVSLSNILRDINEYGLWDTLRGARFLSSTWVPYDLTSAFLIKEDGGAIASFGYSGYGYFWGNGACLNGLCPWICTRFFDSYANQSIDIIGKARDQAIIDYLNIIGGMNDNALHRNTIEGWILMGDPSMKIGGY